MSASTVSGGTTSGKSGSSGHAGSGDDRDDGHGGDERSAGGSGDDAGGGSHQGGAQVTSTPLWYGTAGGQVAKAAAVQARRCSS